MTALRDRLCDWLRAATPAEPDAELLRRFISQRDHDAFAALVERHGRWLLGVCRRVAGPADADDVFQAAFLKLARHAHRLRRPESLPAWMHATARRLALDARRARTRRAAAEARSLSRPTPDPLDELSGRELLAALDAAIARLPEPDRLPLILCCLDGLSLDEAAHRLGVSVGAVKGRLERGRARLLRDLQRRGLTLPAALGAGLLLTPAPAVARPLLDSTLALCAGTAAPSAAVAALLSDSPRRLVPALLLIGALTAGLGLMTIQKPAQPAPRPAANMPPTSRVDIHGDPLPDGAIARLGTERLRPGDSCLALSPDGKTIITASRSMVIREWDAADGRLKAVRRLGNSFPWSRVLSPDGKWFLCHGGNGPDQERVVVWDVTTGKRAFDQRLPMPAGVRGAAFAKGGGLVLALDETATAVCRADFGTGSWQELFRLPLRSPDFMELSPDEKKLAIAGERLLICRDLEAGKELWRIGFHGGGFAFTPDSRAVIAAVGVEKGYEQWDAATGKSVPNDRLPRTDHGWGEWVGGMGAFCFRLTPDGRGLLLHDRERGTILWDMAAGKERLRLPLCHVSNRRSAFSPDGKSLITLDRTLQRWDLATGKPQYADNDASGHTRAPDRLTFSRDGRQLLSVSTDQTARIWDVSAAAPRHVLRSSAEQVSAGLVLPGGKHAVTASNDGQVRLWDARSGKELRAVSYMELGDGGQMFARYLTQSTDGRIVTSLCGLRLKRWDTTNGKVVESKLVKPIIPAPGGKIAYRLGSELSRNGPQIIDIDSQATLGVLTYGPLAEGLPDTNSGVVFSDDARLFATVFREHQRRGPAPCFVLVWDTRGGPPLAAIPTRFVGFLPFAFSRDGRLLAFADADGLRVWDVAAGRAIWHRADNARAAFSLAFVPDGRALAAGYDNTTILLWALPAAEKAKPIPAADRDAVWDALISSDVAAAHDAQWRLVDDPETALDLLRRRFPLKTTPAEVVRPLVADLGSADFKTREAAQRKLEALGQPAEKQLRLALDGESRPEAKRRLTVLLAALDASWPREERAVAVLERIGTPAARRLLEELVTDLAPGRVADDARSALQRLAE